MYKNSLYPMMHTLECLPAPIQLTKSAKKRCSNKHRRVENKFWKSTVQRNRDDRSLYIVIVNLYNQMSKINRMQYLLQNTAYNIKKCRNYRLQLWNASKIFNLVSPKFTHFVYETFLKWHIEYRIEDTNKRVPLV